MAFQRMLGQNCVSIMQVQSASGHPDCLKIAKECCMEAGTLVAPCYSLKPPCQVCNCTSLGTGSQAISRPLQSRYRECEFQLQAIAAC